jgi:hypothetical protein
VIVDGVTAVPDADRDSPSAETPGRAAVGPTEMVLVGAGAVAEVAVVGAIGPVEAGGVPVAVGIAGGEVAGGVPVGVGIFDGVETLDSDVAGGVPGLAGALDVLAAVPLAAGVASEKLLEPRPPPV